MTDPLIAAAQFLTTQLDWLRWATDEQGAPYAASVFAEIAECASKLRGIVNGPSDQKYLGPCGALREHEELCTNRGDQCDPDCICWCHLGESNACDGDVYGQPDATKARCRTCGTEHDRADREVWLDDVRREWLYHASEIADAYPIKADTIRSWLHRKLLVSHGEHDGRPLLKLGEVLDLAAGDAARREEARAKRARRMEQRSGGQAA